MNLNAQIINDEISEYLTESHICTSYKTATLINIDYFDASTMQPHAIHLISAAEIASIPSCTEFTFVVYGSDAFVIPSELASNNWLIAKHEFDDRFLLRLIGSVYYKYAQWEENLRSIVDNNGSLGDLLEASLDITSSNIMLHDRQFHVIAYKMQDHDQSFNDFYNLKEGDFFSRKQLKTVNDSFRKNYGSTNPYSIKEPHFCEWEGLARDLSHNIYLPNNYIVRINFGSADGKTDVPNRCYVLILTLAYYVHLAYMLYPARIATPNQGLMSICLHKLVNGQRLRREEIERAAREKGWNHQNDEFCAFLILPISEKGERLGLASQSAYSIINRAQNIVSDSVAISVNDEVFILWNQTKDAKNTDTFFAKLGDLAQENFLLIVKTHAFKGLRHTQPSYEESQTIIEYLLEQHYQSGCYHIDDTTLGFIYESVKAKIKPSSLVPGKLRRLIEYDETKKSFLYPTLRAYVECNCSVANAAKKLYIERTALYYRLNKALEMLEMDLENPDIQLQLRMSFKILDYEEMKK